MVDTSNLTPQQLKEYTTTKTSYFKGTIAVTVIYGVIALSLFLITLFSPEGKRIVTDTLLPFTITFIGGMIIIIVFLIIAIFSVKAPPQFTLEYDNYKCPDYWNIELTPDNIMNSINKSDDKARMKYRCIKPGATANDRTTPATSVTINRTTPDETMDKLLDSTYVAYGTTYTKSTDTTDGSGKLNCNVVYPDLMNFYDKTWDRNDSMSPNKLRCKYANQCNISWSSACPNR